MSNIQGLAVLITLCAACVLFIIAVPYMHNGDEGEDT